MDRQGEVVGRSQSGLIDVGTAKLYHEVRGSGPALLLISGRGGDAGQWMRVAPFPAQEFTVVTYDRRGLCRSPPPEGWTATSVAEQAEGGPRRAMEGFMRSDVGDEVYIDPVVHERMLDNGAVFFQIELPAFATFVPDREGMRASGVPLTVVVGAENRDSWFGAAAAWLVEGTGADRMELPGRHAGFWSHPEQFVELVRRITRRDGAAHTSPTTPEK
jgi:hypothetical protein